MSADADRCVIQTVFYDVLEHHTVLRGGKGLILIKEIAEDKSLKQGLLGSEASILPLG